MEEKNEQFEVRDLRDKDQFKIDDKFLNGYAKFVGIYAVGVYNSLCRHAQFKSQQSFPSVNKIAEELNISPPKVFYSLWVLETFNIIKRYRVGKKCNNRYDLLHKKHWKSPEQIKQELEQEFKQNNIDIDKILRDKDEKGHIKAVNMSDVKAVNIRYKGSLYHLLRQLTSIVRITKSKDNKKKGNKINSDSEIAPKVKRKDFKVKPEDYKEIIDAYQKYKGIELKGAEFGKVKQAIKTMLYSGRTKQNIIDFMKFCSEIDDDDKDLQWLKNWTILTIKNKMPEFLAGKIKKKVDGEEEENYKVKFYGHTFEN